MVSVLNAWQNYLYRLAQNGRWVSGFILVIAGHNKHWLDNSIEANWPQYRTFYSFTTLIAISLGLGASLLLPAWEPLTSVATIGDDVQLISEDAAGGAAIASKLLVWHS